MPQPEASLHALAVVPAQGIVADTAFLWNMSVFPGNGITQISRIARPSTSYIPYVPQVFQLKGHDRCPWLLMPYRFEKNTYCGMCLEGFKTCPRDNVVLNPRPFGADLLVDTKLEPKSRIPWQRQQS